MDGAKGSQTYQYMHKIDHVRGLQIGAVEARKPRRLLDRGQESICELKRTNLTTCDASASPGALICQIHARKMNRFVDNGPEIHVRCGG